MKTTFILFFVLCVSFVGFSQSKDFQISWGKSQTISAGSYTLELPSFNSDAFNYSFEEGISYIQQWETSGPINERSVQLENVTYSAISKQELGQLDTQKIPSKVEFSLKTAKAREKTYAFLKLSPIVKDGQNTYKRITSFKVSYKFGISSERTNRYNQTISSSVLKSGEWFQFFVDTTGVYRLSKSFIESLGLNVNNINPKQLKIFGNGGQMIPYSNSEVQPFDVVENAIKVVGEEDGSFDNGDYILFYAVGPRGYDSSKNTNINCYTDKTSYYLQIGPNDGKRIQNFIQPESASDYTINTHQMYVFHENDDYNLASLGRRWFGDRFDVTLQKLFTFEIPDLITTESIPLKTIVASTSGNPSAFNVSVNGNSITTLNVSAANDPTLANQAVLNTKIESTNETIRIGLNYDKRGNPSALGYLDYISLEPTRGLKFYGKQFEFYNNRVTTTSGVVAYEVQEASRISEIWNVTDINNVTNLENTESAGVITFKRQSGLLEKFVALTPSDYFTPRRESSTRISNQDLKGSIFSNESGQFQDIDYIIVAPENFYTQAMRLADINTAQYGLNVKVVTLEEIYKEFSTGNPDIAAIRNLIKYVYDNASSEANRLKYVCLFGDGSYDYKDRVQNNTNIVPSWHSYESFSLTNSYISDDFYGMMDENEGNMGTSDRLDIAVGRIIADSPSQAKDMVDKIERYYTDASFGSWRNGVVMVSDDVDESWEVVLEQTTDNIANLISEHKPFLNVTKIHSDAYQQESSAGGNRYTEVNQAMVNAIENGALLVNYFGHGGEDGLAHERIFMKPDAENLTNVCKMNCFVTVTCEYTRFDNPLRPTAGEYTFWNTNGGAISLITTTREIFVSVGIAFNTVLSEYLFAYNGSGSTGNTYPSMAEALRLTKTNSSISGTSQRHLVFYIGDPAMKLAIPNPNIRLTQVNGKAVSPTTEPLKALSKVSLSGEVTDASGQVLTDYNGVLTSTIYDKEIERTTLGNDGTTVNGSVYTMDFTTLGEIIFRGQASVSNGQFQFEFVVPKDIGVPEGYGKLSFYSKTENPTQDQTGASVNQVKIGGINENAPEDNTGPLVSIFMNDENFVSGGITNTSPSLLVKLEDENGINTASGIGHDIVALIDGDETNPYVLNDYYETEIDSYQKGVATYPFRDLEPGLHTLSVKAWDVYNNSSTTEIQFIVFDEDQKLVVNNVLNYPNPFVNYTEFWFNHNSSDTLDVSIQIFTVSGKLVRTLNGQTNGGECCNQGSSSLSRDIVWDGRDDFGDKIGKGVYVYKLTVKSNTLNKTVEKIEKLVIL
ncbi:type IX secretion system sortase PorU [Formosa sp. S-31]|uniref:type IX secretion system sortase PorU n=1 Tax=Formosa sp. S-31 TaxID=2790949 RepID=UPI003EB8145E